MAVQIATADGNYTAAATWGTVDATSLLDSEAANTVLTTLYVESQAFTPGAITIDGFAVKIATRAASPTGTMSLRIAQAAATVAGTEVTVNVSDIQNTVLLSNGWFFVKFAAPVTLLAATPYTVSAKTSNATQVNLYRNATAGNWSRLLRTTTTGAPAAGDNQFILGEWTAAATCATRTVTMDSTATTDYGTPAAAGYATLGISYGGVLTWAASAATNYILRHSGTIFIWTGGIMNMGTVGTPCPRDSSMELQFDCVADGDFGLNVYGVLNMQGQSRLSGSSNHFALLTADAAGGATSLTVDRQLSAKNGDAIAIASTTRTPGDAETVTLSADAGATSLSCGATANAHGGNATTLVQAEVICLERSVRIIAVTSTAATYAILQTGCSVDMDWASIRYYGTSSAGKRGFQWDGTSGTVNINKCVFRESENQGFVASNASGCGAFTFTDNVFYQTTAVNAPQLGISVATSALWTITGCVMITKNTAGAQTDINDVGGNFSNNRLAGGYQHQWGEGGAVMGTWDGNVIHSCSNQGVNFGGCNGGYINGLTIWRSTNAGGLFFSGNHYGLTIDNLTIFGCGSANIAVSTGHFADVTFKNAIIAGDTSFSVPSGFLLSVEYLTRVRFENCQFGVATGVRTTHTTADWSGSSRPNFEGDVTFVNCTFGSATEITYPTVCGKSPFRFERNEGVAGAHSTYYKSLGTNAYDSVLFRTAAPSEKQTPSGASSVYRLPSGVRKFPVQSGQTLTISCYVYKNVAYAGSAPRLVAAANAAAGLTTDSVLDSMSGGAATWEQLSGSVGPVTEDCVITAYVEVDGSAGQVNNDDWSGSVA